LYVSDLRTISNQDTLTIYDGDDNITSPVIARLSGSENVLPNTFASTQQYMLVEFSVTSVLSERGFDVSYRSRVYGMDIDVFLTNDSRKWIFLALHGI